MAKITELPAAEPIAGNEAVPLVQSGQTRQAPAGALIGAATAAANYFTSQAAGEAATTAGQAFSYPDGTGGIVLAERTGGGSIVRAVLGKGVQLADLAAGDGSGMVGHSPGGTGAGITSVQQALRHQLHPDQFTGFDNNLATDDRGTLQNALDRAAALREPLNLNGLTAYCAAIPTGEINWNVGPQPSLIMQPGMTAIDGKGGTIRLAATARGICGGSLWSAYAPYVAGTSVYNAALFGTVAADLAVGARDIPLAAGHGAKFAVGDTVFAKLGELAYDLPEPEEWFFARVTAIAGDTLTLDTPVARPFTLASATTYGKYIVKLPLFDGLTISNLKIEGPVGGFAENGMDIRGVVNATYSNIAGKRMGAGIIIAQMVENLTIRNVSLDGASVSQASYGRVMTIAQGRNVRIENISGRACRHLLFVEAESTVSVSGALFDNTLLNAGSPRTDIIVLSAGGRSLLEVENLTIRGYGGFVTTADNAQTGADYASLVRLSGTTRLQITSEPKQFPVRTTRGRLDLQVAGVRQRYDFDNQVEWTRRIYLKNGMYLDNILGPSGILTNAEIYLSPGLAGRFGTGLELPSVFVGRVGNNGFNVITSTGVLAGPPVAGSLVGLQTSGGSDYGILWTGRASRIKVLVSTAAGTGLNADNEYIELRMKFAPEARRAEGISKTYDAWSDGEWRAQSGPVDLREVVFAAYDLPSIAAAATLQVDFPIADMAAGDLIQSISLASGLAGLSIRSAEAIAGNCRVIFENQTAGAIDKAATNITIQWCKPVLGV